VEEVPYVIPERKAAPPDFPLLQEQEISINSAHLYALLCIPSHIFTKE
jgi:hypothetical protein